MTGRRAILVVALVLALLTAWLILRPGEVNPPPSSATGASAPLAPRASPPPEASPPSMPVPVPAVPAGYAASASKPLPALPPGSVAVVPTVPDGTAAPTPPNPQTEVEKVRRMITDYHTLMGENPVGTNAEIMHALMGANPHQAMLGPPEGQVLNGKGELVDPWGTPYFFHQLSRDVMEIHSAGPDKIMGTPDDVVTR